MHFTVHTIDQAASILVTQGCIPEYWEDIDADNGDTFWGDKLSDLLDELEDTGKVSCSAHESYHVIELELVI